MYAERAGCIFGHLKEGAAFQIGLPVFALFGIGQGAARSQADRSAVRKRVTADAAAGGDEGFGGRSARTQGEQPHGHQRQDDGRDHRRPEGGAAFPPAGDGPSQPQQAEDVGTSFFRKECRLLIQPLPDLRIVGMLQQPQMHLIPHLRGDVIVAQEPVQYPLFFVHISLVSR